MTYEQFNEAYSEMKSEYLSGNLKITPQNAKIVKAWDMSRAAGADPYVAVLSDRTRDMEVFQRLDDIYRIQLAYFDEYYKDSNKALDNLGCARLYLDSSFTIYYKSGNQELLNELKRKGIRTGSNLSVSNIGVFAGNIDFNYPFKNIMTLGTTHFCEILKDYGCIARYCQSQEYPALISNQVIFFPMSRYTKAMKSFIEFMLESEGANHNSYDKSISYPKLQRKLKLLEKSAFYSMESELLVDENGKVAFFNNLFEKEFNKIMSSYDIDIGDFMPELATIKESLASGSSFHMKEFRLPNHTGRKNLYYVDCLIMKENGKTIGAKVTIKPAKELHRVVARASYQNAFFNFDDILGESAAMQRAKEYARRAALSDSNIIITGESGTGKELFAQAIHNASQCANGPFIPINCGAVPKELIGTELFGYVGGAFTGANKNGSPGKIEMADGGTLFLDEVGELSLDMQVYLLRFLETGVISRIGGSDYLPVNVRIVCATNRDLRKSIRQGIFREDLFYRLNVISISLPPLREHPEDIGLLVKHYVKTISEHNGKHIRSISPNVMRRLNMYKWPGNIRELRNTIERSVVETPDNSSLVLSLEDGNKDTAGSTLYASIVGADKRVPHYKEYEEQLIRELMVKFSGNKSAVAGTMGISRSTLYKKLREIDYEG